jgi:choline binding protein A
MLNRRHKNGGDKQPDKKGDNNMSTTLTRVAAATAVAATLALATPTGAMAAPADTQGSGDELVHMLTTGTSTIFETNGRWVLVGGDHAAYQYLKNRGVKTLDAYVAPNANPDVIEDAPAIIRDFKPANVYATTYADSIAASPAPGAGDAYTRLTGAMQAANRAYGARTTVSHDDTRFTVGDMTFNLYHTLPGARYKSGAASSTGGVGYMVKASAHGLSVLLSGDAQAKDGIGQFDDSLTSRVGTADWVTAPNRGRADGGAHGFTDETALNLVFQQGSADSMAVWQTWGAAGGRNMLFHADVTRNAGHAELTGAFTDGTVQLVGDYGDVEHVLFYENPPVEGAPAAWFFKGGKLSAKTGWWQRGGSWYWFNGADHNSVGELIGDGKGVYWMGYDGRLVTGPRWFAYNAHWYYMQADGSMLANGWHKVGNSWYYMDGLGAAQIGWVNDGTGWFYMDPATAKMVTGWVHVANGDGEDAPLRWYYMDAKGRMATGWQLIGGSWYWFDGSGAMAEGGVTAVDGVRHLFDGSGRWLGHA